MELIETITLRNLPDEFCGTYETKGVYNLVKNQFYKISNKKTKYISEQEFKFSGFMRIIGCLFPSSFKKTIPKISFRL